MKYFIFRFQFSLPLFLYFNNRNIMQKLLKVISKISVFSLFGIIMNGWLSYIFLSLWLHPQASDIELIYSLTILVLFEFILVHSGVFMSILGRSWKGWVGFILVYGLFALGMNTFVNGNQIIILYGVVVLNRMLTGILNSGKADKELGLSMSAVYVVTYFGLLLAVVFGSSYIPRCGLTEAFVQSTDYVSFNMAGGDFADMPHVFMCFGVMYYLILMFVEINAEIHSVKVSLQASTAKGYVINKQLDIENEQPERTIFHQFEKDGVKPAPGCGCSPWLVFVLAASLTAIGVYQRIDNAKINNNGIVTHGVISARKGIKSGEETKYLVSVTFSVEGKEYTFTAQDYMTGIEYGDTLLVVYPPNHPGKATIAGTKFRQEGENLFIWLGIMLILVWTGLVLTGRKLIRRKDTVTNETNKNRNVNGITVGK